MRTFFVIEQCVIVSVLVWLAVRTYRERTGAAFRRALDYAQACWDRGGNEHPDTQRALFAAMRAWQRWQRRDGPPLKEEDWTEADWSFSQLARCSDDAAAVQRVQ